MYGTMHGRDQLSQNWPRLYTVQQGAEEPAEELVSLTQGADFGRRVPPTVEVKL
jgi:hypothetical protein